MSKNRDPLTLTDHWHVDCRLVTELPDDRVVSGRFLINLPFGAVALVLAVFFGLNVSTDLSLRNFIGDWNRRLYDSRLQIAGIRQMQRDYTVASAKIEMAHTLVRNRLFISNFLSELGRTRPDQMTINSIDTTNQGVIVRGTLGESSDRATLLIGKYVAQLSKDPELGKRFEITVTSFERERGTDQQYFEVTFRFLPNAP